MALGFCVVSKTKGEASTLPQNFVMDELSPAGTLEPRARHGSAGGAGGCTSSPEGRHNASCTIIRPTLWKTLRALFQPRSKPMSGDCAPGGGPALRWTPPPFL